jgi:hypothetical protein
MMADDKCRPFPLDVVRVPSGFGIVVYLQDGVTWNLLKPGWENERADPYIFPTAEQAWNFLRDIFMFCLKQHHTQYLTTDKIMNCEHCGRIIRARFYRFCPQCLQENEFLFQQIWQGFYHMTGSDNAALQRLLLMLKIPPEHFTGLPDAFGSLVKRNLEAHLETGRPKEKAPKSNGLHITRRC